MILKTGQPTFTADSIVPNADPPSKAVGFGNAAQPDHCHWPVPGTPIPIGNWNANYHIGRLLK